MTITGRANEWLSIILKFMLIVVLVGAISWFALSVIGNVTEASPSAIPKLPDIKKAQYMVVIKATGEPLLTDSYDIIGDGSYVLHGYYSVVDGKWKWHKGDLPLDGKYFGEITIKRRET